ncbi:MAG: RimK family alpha-L-glutamate ligase [Fimbriimonadales bacterium]
MPKIGFVTTAELPAMPASDVLVRAELEKLGHEVQAILWDAGEPTERLDLVVFRSCWNYHLHPDAFRCWIQNLDAAGKQTLNPAATLLWNLDKRYLLEIAAHVPIVPTEVLLNPTPADIEAVRLRHGWAEIIVKPAIGCTAYQNRRLLTAEDFAGLANDPLPEVSLVQPYLRSIQSDGEFALIFFDGIYSHAVRKTPAEGDYRVQEEFVGWIRPAQPPEDVRAVAQRAVDFLPEPPIYARVDVAFGDHGPIVMELELIEPELFIDRTPEAAARFAAAIHARIG